MAKPADPNRREDILKAAREVFKQNGYAGAHVAEIGKRARQRAIRESWPVKARAFRALCDRLVAEGPR